MSDRLCSSDECGLDSPRSHFAVAGKLVRLLRGRQLGSRHAIRAVCSALRGERSASSSYAIAERATRLGPTSSLRDRCRQNGLGATRRAAAMIRQYAHFTPGIQTIVYDLRTTRAAAAPPGASRRGRFATTRSGRHETSCPLRGSKRLRFFVGNVRHHETWNL
jgi:hypothetical protein